MRRSSLDLPGGSVQTEGGEILLRTKGQAYRGADFAGILLRSRRDGTQLWLREVAQVVDGFAETDTEGLFSSVSRGREKKARLSCIASKMENYHF